MFEKKDFNDDFLSLDTNLKIKANENSIIFAPNGTGKSTIYKTILTKNQDSSDYFFIDYENLRLNFIKNKKKITFGPRIDMIKEIDEKVDKLLKSNNLNNSIKNLGITTQAKAKEVFDGFENKFKDNLYLTQTFNVSKLDVLVPLKKYRGFIVKNYKSLKKSKELRTEIAFVKDYQFLKLYSEVRQVLNSNTTVCPVCQTDKNVSILSIIEEKEKELSKLNSTIIKSFISENANLSTNQITEKLETIVQTISENNIEDHDIVSFAIIDFDDSESITNVVRGKEDVIKLLEDRAKVYGNLQEFFERISKEPRYKEQLSKIFKVPLDDVKFDDENFVVTVELSRDISTYSTGEINVALFITSLFEFIQSDATNLVMDDPISSFDMPNQYKIIFELVKLVNDININKNIVMFTHNLEVFNISKSERSDFKYYVIESSRSRSSHNDIAHLSMIPVHFNKSISFKEMMERIKDIDKCREKYHYILALKKREESANSKERLQILKNIRTGNNNSVGKPLGLVNGNIKKVVNRNLCRYRELNLNKLFHFNGVEETINFPSFDNINLSNMYLINLIEDFNSNSFILVDSSKKGFYTNAVEKIIYVSALRVWIEKQLFNLTPDLKKEKFSKFRTLSQKINFTLDDNDPELRKLKDNLMYKKSMLNQNSHYFSQISPFNYVLNLSIYNIENEINEIKDLFLLARVSNLQ